MLPRQNTKNNRSNNDFVYSNNGETGQDASYRGDLNGGRVNLGLGRGGGRSLFTTRNASYNDGRNYSGNGAFSYGLNIAPNGTNNGGGGGVYANNGPNVLTNGVYGGETNMGLNGGSHDIFSTAINGSLNNGFSNSFDDDTQNVLNNRLVANINDGFAYANTMQNGPNDNNSGLSMSIETLQALLDPWNLNFQSPKQSDLFITDGEEATGFDANLIGPIGSGVRSAKMSPESNSSSVGCNSCDLSATVRCKECNDFLCNDCLREHPHKCPLSTFVSVPTPIGASPTGSNNALCNSVPNYFHCSQYMCDMHNEVLRYVCECCVRLVCQGCTLHDHQDHTYSSIEAFVENSQTKIQAALNSSGEGTRSVKGSIDRALAFIRLFERNCNELGEQIRRFFRTLVIALEDRERILVDSLEKLRQRRLTGLHDQMAGLKSALSGLAETSDALTKLSVCASQMDHMDLAIKITKSQRELEQLFAVCNDLRPKHEEFVFLPPDPSPIPELQRLGNVAVLSEKNATPVPIDPILGIIAKSNGVCNRPPGNPGNSGNSGNQIINTGSGGAPPSGRRPLLRRNSSRNGSPPLVNGTFQQTQSISGVSPANNGTITRGTAGNGLHAAVSLNSINGSNGMNKQQPMAIPSVIWNGNIKRDGLQFGAPHAHQTVPGSKFPVRLTRSNALSLSFAPEGHNDGEVSRPWGICVDRYGHLLVSDRRNNRVQVFFPDGRLKHKFGYKGNNNGEFDLPAGICVDSDNRIIVVDKDNHRVQIFAHDGLFLNKFGSYGKEYGQFQYPWDVAVNSRRQMVVTDSRNHRIQQFDSEGRFIRHIVFDYYGQNRGVASPRGVCYTPCGNIIVTDFDNHCLYLVDPDRNEIVGSDGSEGSGHLQFNRPSGICCDDEGRVIIADSKNQRIIIFENNLRHSWTIDVRPTLNPLMPRTLDDKDRTCDVALTPDGRLVFLIELSPDSKEGSHPYKRFVHVF